MKETVIPKEKAVFWMDSRGYWHNRHGRFAHKKIIDYFHSAIQKDDCGFYVCQQLDDRIEKVYFRYDDTALFVFDIIWEHPILLVLNTKAKIRLEPERLFIREDQLYQRHGEDVIKFSESSLLKMARHIDVSDDQYMLCIEGEYHVIERK